MSLLLIGGTIAAGLLVRFASTGLPWFVQKYGGSSLWALTIYWMVSTIRPGWPVGRAGVLSGLIATAVEFFKLYRSPSVDSFRHTLPGVLLLGRYFSVRDLVAYCLAILAGAFADWLFRRSVVK